MSLNRGESLSLSRMPRLENLRIRELVSVITIIESEAIAIIEGRTKSAHGAAG